MFYESEPGKSIQRTRLREVDFTRIEDSGLHEALSPFELEVKEKLTDGKTPLTALMESEESRYESEYLKAQRKALAHLLQSEVLTKRQRECYELFYVQGFNDKEIAHRLGISRSRVRVIRWSLKKTLRQAALKKQKLEVIAENLKTTKLTRNQKRVWDLHAVQGLSAHQISEKLGKTKDAVYWALRKVREKFPA